MMRQNNAGLKPTRHLAAKYQFLGIRLIARHI